MEYIIFCVCLVGAGYTSYRVGVQEGSERMLSSRKCVVQWYRYHDASSSLCRIIQETAPTTVSQSLCGSETDESILNRKKDITMEAYIHSATGALPCCCAEKLQ